MKLWKQGENVYLSGQQEDGTHKEFSHSFNEKVEAIRKAKAEMNRQRDCLNNLDVEHLPWMVSAFIENVFVYDGGRIVVRFKYEQSIQDAVKALHTG